MFVFYLLFYFLVQSHFKDFQNPAWEFGLNSTVWETGFFFFFLIGINGQLSVWDGQKETLSTPIYLVKGIVYGNPGYPDQVLLYKTV